MANGQNRQVGLLVLSTLLAQARSVVDQLLAVHSKELTQEGLIDAGLISQTVVDQQTAPSSNNSSK